MPTYTQTKRSLVKAVTFRTLILCSDAIVIFLITHRWDETTGLVIATNLATLPSISSTNASGATFSGGAQRKTGLPRHRHNPSERLPPCLRMDDYYFFYFFFYFFFGGPAY